MIGIGQIVALFAALLLGAYSVWSSPSDTVPIVWENVERSLGGITPTVSPVVSRRFGAEDLLSLTPDDYSIIELPADAWLRLEAVAGDLSGIEVSQGNGTGLFLPLKIQRLDADLGLVSPDYRYRQIHLHNFSDQRVTLSLYRGAVVQPSNRWRQLPASETPRRARLLRPDRIDDVDQVSRGSALGLELEPGQPIQIQAWPLAGDGLGQSVPLTITEDGQQQDIWLVSQPVRGRVLLDDDGCWQLTDQTHLAHFIPSSASIELSAKRPMALRVRSIDSVFRWSINSDPYDLTSSAESGFEAKLLAAGHAPSDSLSETLSKVHPLRQSRMRQRLWRRHTLWRSPAMQADQVEMRFKRARARLLQRQADRPSLRAEDAAQALGNAPLLEWVQLTPGNPVEISLPPRAHHSELQLLVESATERPLELAVAYDQELPQWIHVRATGPTFASDFDAAALVLQRGQIEADKASVTNRSAQHWPDSWPVVTAAAGEMALPQRVQRVSLQTPVGQESVWAALRYRDVRPFRWDGPVVDAELERADELWQQVTSSLLQGRPEPSQFRSLLALLRARADNVIGEADGRELDFEGQDWLNLAAQADAAGDRSVARRLYRLIARQAPTVKDREAALDALSDAYLESSDALQRQRYLAWRMIHLQDREVMLDLAGALQEEGDYQLAMAAALIAVDSAQRRRLISALTEQMGWTDPTSNGPLAAAAASWLPAPLLEVDGLGTALVHSVARDTYFRMWRAAAEQPLHWRLSEAGKVRITLRRVGSTEQVAQIVSVKLADQSLPIALKDGFSTGLKLVAEDGPIGLRSTAILELTGGGRLSIAPDQGEVLVTIEQWRDPVVAAAGVSSLADGEAVQLDVFEQCQVRAIGGRARMPVVSPLPEGAAMRLAQRPDRANAESIVWSELKAQWNEPGSDRRRLWQRALLLAEQQPLLIPRLDELTPGSWRRIEQVVSSAGVVTESVVGWQPESPAQQLRQQMIDVPEQSWLLRNRRTEHLQLDLLNPQRLRVQLQLRALPTVQAEPIEVTVTAQSLQQIVTLDPNEPQQLLLDLPAGVQRLSFTRSDSIHQHYVLIDVNQKRAGGWQPIAREVDRQYWVARTEQPLVLNLPEPAWLRVNRWDGSQHQADFRLSTEAGPLRFVPAVDQNEAWLRVFRFEPDWEFAPGELSLSSVVEPELESDPIDSRPSQFEVTRADDSALGSSISRLGGFEETGIPRAGAEDGTWSVGIEWRQRLELDASDTEGGEEYAELNWNYRRQSDRPGWWWQTELLGRNHRQGDNAMGFRSWLDWQPRQWPWSGSLNIAAWQQDTAAGDAARTLSLRGQLDFETRRNQDWAQRTRLGVFGRDFNSVAEQIAEFDEIDQDVASRYKLTHRYGWDLQHRITWRQYEDSQWWVQGRLRGNEFGDELLDQAGIDIAWRNFFAGLSFDVGIRNRWFADDDDRSRSRSAQRLFADARWLDFPAHRWGWQARLGWVHDLGNDESAIQLRIEWLADDSRNVRDFRPRSLAFRGLHQDRAEERPWDTGLSAYER